MIVKREVELSVVPSGRSMLVELFRDDKGIWFFRVHDEPLKDMYGGFMGDGTKTLKGTLNKMSKRWGKHMDNISKIMLARYS